MTTMKQFRWFWAWDDEKEEVWLREMAQKGWHFQSVALPGYYTFESGEPRDDVYRLDHFVDNKNSKADYLQLFLDAGWDYMGEMNSWQYFRKTAVNGEIPEIFTDNESKAKKYQRILFFMVIVSLPIYLNAINLINNHTSTLSESLLTFVVFLFMIVYSYGILRLIIRLAQLKKKI
jgi:hypothetical protein